MADTAPKVHELSEFLVDVLGVTDVGAHFPHRVTYHPTCHSLRMLGVGDRPLQLLRAVRGLTLVDLPAAEECCGFGGTFAVKNADTSVAMGSDKARHVRDTGAEVLVAGDNSCLMHVGGLLSRQRAGVRTMHLAEILAATAVSGTFVGMPAFPAAARAALGDTQLRHNLAHATHTIRDKRARVVAEVEDWEELRLTGAAIKEAALRDLERHLVRLEASLQAAGRGGALGQRRGRGQRDRRPDREGPRRRRGRQGQVDGHPGDRPQRGAGRARHRRLGDRPGRADRAAGRGPALATSWCRRSTATAPRSARSSVTRMAAAGRPAPEGLTDDPAALAGAARLHLREKFLRAKVAVSGANFAIAETGTLVVVESEGNGRMCLTLPEVLVSVVGIEKVVPDLGGPRRVPAAAAAVVDRRADEPLHVHLVRGHAPATARRRCTSYSSTTGAPGRSPTRSAARRCAASGARPASTCARSTSGSAGTPTARSTRARSARSSTR